VLAVEICTDIMGFLGRTFLLSMFRMENVFLLGLADLFSERNKVLPFLY